MTTSLLEELAELEHEQWIKWSKDIAEKETLSPERVARWTKFWVPYSELDEATKEHDRVWARRALRLLVSDLEPMYSGFLYFTKDDKTNLRDWIARQMDATREPAASRTEVGDKCRSRNHVKCKWIECACDCHQRRS